MAASLLVLAGCDPGPKNGSQSVSAIPITSSPTANFLSRHWQRPLQRNGPAPARFSLIEASLAPAACGACHPRQLEDWQTALHSRAMGPGLLGQLKAMGAEAREEHQACLQCHAPLAEQAEHLVESLAADRILPPQANGGSSAHGLTCAGCHVRKNARFGPLRQDGTAPSPDAPLPHDGWQATSAFSDSSFCTACHQFEADGPSLNGKPLENTYVEWQTSRHAREGHSCQSCHMPQRRHLWRGIHDAEMVRSGLSIEATPPTVADGRVNAKLSITNTGIGHAFPTYVTPKIVVEMAQEDRHGKIIAVTVVRHLIVRDVSLDLVTERADTRLMPDEKRPYNYDRPLAPRAVSVVFRLTVYPDAFYAKFYRATLRDPDFTKGRAAIHDALRKAEASPYELYLSRWHLSKAN
jgi:hypothetical protein